MIKKEYSKVSNSSKKLLLISLLVFFSVYFIASVSAELGFADNTKPTLKSQPISGGSINNNTINVNDSANLGSFPASQYAKIGNCPAGFVVQNTTNSGVQCVPISVASGFTNGSNIWVGNLSIGGITNRSPLDINTALTVGNVISGSATQVDGVFGYFDDCYSMSYDIYAYRSVAGRVFYSQTPYNIPFSDTCTSSTGYKIALSWGAVSGATGYKVVIINNDYFGISPNENYMNATTNSIDDDEPNVPIYINEIPVIVSPKAIGIDAYINKSTSEWISVGGYKGTHGNFSDFLQIGRWFLTPVSNGLMWNASAANDKFQFVLNGDVSVARFGKAAPAANTYSRVFQFTDPYDTVERFSFGMFGTNADPAINTHAKTFYIAKSPSGGFIPLFNVTQLDVGVYNNILISGNETVNMLNARFTNSSNISIQAGLSTRQARVGGRLNQSLGDTVNSGTDETALITYPIFANTTINNGDTLNGYFAGSLLGSGTATKQLKLYYWNGSSQQTIADTGALSLATNADYKMTFDGIRVNSSRIEFAVALNAGASLGAYTWTTIIDNVKFSTLNQLNFTATSAGVGSGTGAISLNNSKLNLEVGN